MFSIFSFRFKNELSASLEKTISKSLFGSFKETIDSSFSQMKIDLTSFFQGMAGELPVTEVSMENRMVCIATTLFYLLKGIVTGLKFRIKKLHFCRLWNTYQQS